MNLPPIDILLCFFTQVAYEQEDYYHSVQWLEESVRLFRKTESQWSPENEATLQDALDHLAFSHFKVGQGTFKTDIYSFDVQLHKVPFSPRQETSPQLSAFLKNCCITVLSR